MHDYHVYILASRSRTLYVGITNDLNLRVAQHRRGECAFTARYKIHRLVFAEATSQVYAAIAREKQIKGYSRAKKVALITDMNPGWDDLLPGSADPSLRSG